MRELVRWMLLLNQVLIDTITSKTVPILGRFTEERKKVLDALKDQLRLRNYLPIVFDFDKPSRRDIDETVSLLARMSRFVIADVTDAKSIPQELKGCVESSPSVPVVPLIWKEQRETVCLSILAGILGCCRCTNTNPWRHFCETLSPPSSRPPRKR